MKPSTKLIQIIKESIQDYIKEIDQAGNIAAQEAKINACDEAIALREKKINLEGIDEAMHEMIDQGKVNELKKEIKELQKNKTRFEKVLDKLKGKASWNDKENGASTNAQEIDVDGDLEEMTTDPEAGAELENTEGTQLEEAKKKPSAGMTKKEKSDVAKKAHAGKDIGKKGKGFEKVEKAAEKEYGSKTAGKKVAAAAMWKNAAKKAKANESVEEPLNEQFVRMQKLAGIITENNDQKKK